MHNMKNKNELKDYKNEIKRSEKNYDQVKIKMNEKAMIKWN